MSKLRKHQRKTKTIEMPYFPLQQIQVFAQDKSPSGEIIWQDVMQCDLCRKYSTCLMKTNYCQMGHIIASQLPGSKLRFSANGPIVYIPTDEIKHVKMIVSGIKKTFTNNRAR